MLSARSLQQSQHLGTTAVSWSLTAAAAQHECPSLTAFQRCGKIALETQRIAEGNIPAALSGILACFRPCLGILGCFRQAGPAVNVVTARAGALLSCRRGPTRYCRAGTGRHIIVVPALAGTLFLCLRRQLWGRAGGGRRRRGPARAGGGQRGVALGLSSLLWSLPWKRPVSKSRKRAH